MWGATVFMGSSSAVILLIVMFDLGGWGLVVKSNAFLW